MNEATLEVVKKHLEEKERALRAIGLGIRYTEINLDRDRMRREDLLDEIKSIRSDLEEAEEEDDGEEVGPIGTAYVDVMPRFDGFIDALKKLNED